MKDTTLPSTDTTSIVLTLPYPVSVNAMHGYGKGRVFRSPAYKEWIAEAHVAWLRQRPKMPVKSVSGRYRLSIYATPPDKQRRDIGNLEKATSDFLVMMGIVRDDSLAKSVFTEWDDEATNHGIRVEITYYT